MEERFADATLDELLDDPIAQALMDRDRVDREELCRMLDEMRRLRETREA